MGHQSWQVGEVSITKVVELEAPVPGGGEGSALPLAFPEAVREIRWLVPDFATDEGHLFMSIHSLLVETPTTRMVVDTCVGKGKRRSNPLFHMLESGYLDGFRDASGWELDTVDSVLCTHLHTDHVGWNTVRDEGGWRPTFPGATYYVGGEEFDHWRADDEHPDAPELLVDSVQPLLDAGVLSLVASDAEIAPGIRLVPTPGHTPGHVSVVVESGGEQAVILGDVMHHPCQVARPDWWSGFDVDPERATATRRRFLEEFVDTGTLVIGTHFGGPTAGRIVTDGEGFRFEV